MRQASAPSPTEGLDSDSETVIIVEPDTGLLRALRFDLELDGFAVQTHRSIASLTPSTLPLAKACLVIEDNLPGANGVELLQRLRSADIHLPAVIMTSLPTAALGSRVEALGAVMLEKPLLGGALTMAVRRLIACSQDASPP